MKAPAPAGRGTFHWGPSIFAELHLLDLGERDNESFESVRLGEVTPLPARKASQTVLRVAKSWLARESCENGEPRVLAAPMSPACKARILDAARQCC